MRDLNIPTRKSEIVAKYLLEMEGYIKVRRIRYYDNLPKPKPDLLAELNGKQYRIEVKSFRPTYYKLQPVAQSPKDIDYIMIIDLLTKHWIMIEPYEYWNGKKFYYNIHPRKLVGWKQFVMPKITKRLGIFALYSDTIK